MTTRRRAFLELEGIAAITILVTLIGAFTLGMFQLARSSHALISREQATLAAESVLNRLRDGATPTDDELESRFRYMTFHIERTPATGDFEGLDLATVHVEAFTFGKKTATVQLSGFVKKEATP